MSMSFASGNKITNTYSDIVLLNEDLTLVPQILSYTNKSKNVLNQIIWFTLFYNFVFIILASLNIISIGLAPFGEIFTTIIIVVWVLRLSWFKK